MKQSDHGRRTPLRRAAALLPVLLCMSAIYGFSSRTGDDLGTLMPWFHRLFPAMRSFDWAHFIAYFVLALCAAYAIGERAERWRYKALIVLFCLLYGLTDEYHQSFVPGRTSDPGDLRNDGIGAAAAVLLLAVPALRRLWRRIPR